MTENNLSYSADQEIGQVRRRRTRGERIRLLLKKSPFTARIGLVIIIFYGLMALVGPFFAPYGESEIAGPPLAPWGDGFVFGTDQIGRDILSRLIYGARNTIGIALAATLLAFFIGGGLGLVAAISRGWLDQLISRGIDVIMAIPALIFALMLLTITGSNVWALIVIIALLDSTRVFRLTRSVAVSVSVMDYVEAARLRGEGLGWTMRREVLPNILPPLVAEFGLRFCFVFLTIAALSFLGVGIQPPTADWGTMVRETANMMQFARFDITAGLTPLMPAACIALLTIGVNFVVDWFLQTTSGLRDDR